MRLSATYDIARANSKRQMLNFIRLSHEFHDLFSDNISNKYKECDLTIGVAMRLYSKDIAFKTFRRFYKSENYLTLDFCFLTEDFDKMFYIEMKHKISHSIFSYIENSLRKYKILELNIENFMSDLGEAMEKYGWIADEIDYSLVEDGEW